MNELIWGSLLHLHEVIQILHITELENVDSLHQLIIINVMMLYNLEIPFHPYYSFTWCMNDRHREHPGQLFSLANNANSWRTINRTGATNLLQSSSTSWSKGSNELNFIENHLGTATGKVNLLLIATEWSGRMGVEIFTRLTIHRASRAGVEAVIKLPTFRRTSVQKFMMAITVQSFFFMWNLLLCY